MNSNSLGNQVGTMKRMFKTSTSFLDTTKRLLTGISAIATNTDATDGLTMLGDVDMDVQFPLKDSYTRSD